MRPVYECGVEQGKLKLVSFSQGISAERVGAKSIQLCQLNSWWTNPPKKTLQHKKRKWEDANPPWIHVSAYKPANPCATWPSNRSVIGVSESPDPPACRTSKRMCVYVHLCLCVCASVRVCVCASVRSVCVHVVCVWPHPRFSETFFFAMFHMNVHSRAGMLGFIVVRKRCLWFNRLNRDLLFCKRILLVTVNIHDITQSKSIQRNMTTLIRWKT